MQTWWREDESTARDENDTIHDYASSGLTTPCTIMEMMHYCSISLALIILLDTWVPPCLSFPRRIMAEPDALVLKL